MSDQNDQSLVSEKQPTSGRRRALTAGKWVISAVLLAVVLYYANIREVLESLRQVNVGWLLAAACLQPVGSYLTAMRWRALLHSQGVKASQWYLFRSCIAANFFKQFTPSTIGGDTVRAYDSWRAGASTSVAVSTLLVDRLLGVVVLAGFVVIAMAFIGNEMTEYQLLPIWVGVGAIVLVAMVCAIFVPPDAIVQRVDAIAGRMPRPLARLYGKVAGSIEQFRGQRKLLGSALAISVILQVNVVVFYYFISIAMGFDIPLTMFFVIVPLATFVMLLPISINGIGVRESVFVALLAAYGVSGAEAVAFAWVEYGIFLCMGIIGGLLYFFTNPQPSLQVVSGSPPVRPM